ncbi:similar to Saccharomyces cerevisiae YHL006C SHU1 Protein involved in a Rad51p-, Rad54p-dependent pathway for homologous recombination repair [Maudiozyma saulgeensis]|uniref:Similar to Saccharomyces cerevisiae YHL006C SHU1 Protein involved in a Rad51p-, Rad54p-dependent pathway for homologous recombination repair n=1 Tax=Maudiozyma saulgeensis TaxID=1789683 RepID=A0A1X7R808_9SACH|nr:similar to Saccharomyces cerevisiae YHL006C SHU1 Protein involved in a Rad51p-, Rad54p-dependent pathway for homologous recombination repair [Kazachstania saulgeensis]
MGINEVVDDLTKKDGKTLVFVLGQDARDKIEAGLTSCDNNLSTIEKSRHDIKVLFLNKLQYLFMFLMKLEAEKTCIYDNIVLYGLDSLVLDKDNVEIIRLLNLILSTLYKVYRLHNLNDIITEWYDNTKDTTTLDRMVDYWKFLLC